MSIVSDQVRCPQCGNAEPVLGEFLQLSRHRDDVHLVRLLRILVPAI